MSSKLVLAIGAAVIVIGTLVVSWFWRPANNADFPQGTWWICQDKDCAAEFNLSMKALGEHHEKHYGQPIPCPKCEKTQTIRAQKCPHCGKVYPMTREPTACPVCGKKPTQAN